MEESKESDYNSVTDCFMEHRRYLFQWQTTLETRSIYEEYVELREKTNTDGRSNKKQERGSPP